MADIKTTSVTKVTGVSLSLSTAEAEALCKLMGRTSHHMRVNDMGLSAGASGIISNLYFGLDDALKG